MVDLRRGGSCWRPAFMVAAACREPEPRRAALEGGDSPTTMAAWLGSPLEEAEATVEAAGGGCEVCMARVVDGGRELRSGAMDAGNAVRRRCYLSIKVMGSGRRGETVTTAASCSFGSAGCWWFGRMMQPTSAGCMQAGGQISRDLTTVREDEKHGLPALGTCPPACLPATPRARHTKTTTVSVPGLTNGVRGYAPMGWLVSFLLSRARGHRGLRGSRLQLHLSVWYPSPQAPACPCQPRYRLSTLR